MLALHIKVIKRQRKIYFDHRYERHNPKEIFGINIHLCQVDAGAIATFASICMYS